MRNQKLEEWFCMKVIFPSIYNKITKLSLFCCKRIPIHTSDNFMIIKIYGRLVAPSPEHEMFDLRVTSSSSMLDVETTYIHTYIHNI